MTDTPQVLLQHHLKKLKLPTFQSEYAKLARQCAAEGRDHVQYLLRLCELELIERERRMIERRIFSISRHGLRSARTASPFLSPAPRSPGLCPSAPIVGPQISASSARNR